MNDKILKDYGWCQVIQRNENYVIRFDIGGIAIQMIEESINKTQVDKALVDQYEAEKVVREILKSKDQP